VNPLPLDDRLDRTGAPPTARLRAALGARLDGELLTDPMSRSLWATDASIYRRRPHAVVVARSERDIRRTLGAARACGLSVTPRGAGTSLAGQATAPGIALDCSALDRLCTLDPHERTCEVEPGLVQARLNAAAAPHGLELGADTSTADVATLGGMIANNSAGLRSIVHGTTARQVLALRCVLADTSVVDLAPLSWSEAARRARGGNAHARLLAGVLELRERYGEEIRRRYPPMVRRVSGYGLDALLDEHALDLSRLVCGSEGTLAVVTRARLRLVATPAVRRMAVLEFPSLLAAAAATPGLLHSAPSALELIDRVALDRARANPAYRDAAAFVRGDPDAVLLIEWSGGDEQVADRLTGLGALAAGAGAERAHVLAEPDRRRTIALRQAVLPLLLATPGRAKPVAFVEDAAVPPERLCEFVERFAEIVRRHDTWACFYGHASVGTLHVRPAIDTTDAGGVRHMRRIAEEVADLVVDCGGSISGEHGDGLSRSPFLAKMYGPGLLRAFAELKRLWDPDSLLNPGVIVDPEPMDHSLRLGPGRPSLEVHTRLDFSAEGGFAAAVTRCNGAGLCRTTTHGTMCPSYMATADEQATTRARANALRSVLDGTLAPRELYGRRLHDVLDLCLACRACRTECPTQVDMAALKTEVLAQRGAHLGFGARERLVAHARGGLRLAGLAPGLVNALTGTRAARLAAERWLDVDRRRPLPRVAPVSFSRRFAALPRAATGTEVALFNDTWTEHQRPDIGVAAAATLTAAGARVVLPDVVCCGRPMLSTGLVAAARRHALRNLDVLAPLAARGVPLAVLEPSCRSALSEDYARLLPGDPRVSLLAAAARSFEETLLALEPPPLRAGEPVLVHGHCHEKAMLGDDASERALALAPGTEVRSLDAGCCGMAGWFGYERNHYDVSMRIGERRLFPALRADPGAPVIAAGTSCREQIAAGTGRRALHPAEYLAARLHR
jgi:FAD/FMN-containing dehydrogenase/Fe-S oxidoreductase